MIEYINIKNFQSHKNTKLVFDPGVNVIVGGTDSGKSAVLRALRWVIWNKPGGNSFRSNWGGVTQVEIGVDGKSIVRSKDKSELYKLDETEFKAFGTGKVPIEIDSFLRMPVDNFQQQLDGPFLLNLTPGEVAKHYNTIANLEQIDKARDSIQKEVNRINQTIKFNESEIEKENKLLEQFDDIPVIEKKLKKIERLNKKADKINDWMTEIDESIYQHESISDIEKEAKLIIEGEESVNKCLELFKEQDQIEEDYNNLKYDIDKFKDLHTQSENAILLTCLEHPVNKLLAVNINAKRFNKEITDLNSLINTIQTTNKKVKETGGKLTVLSDKFKELKVCPFCDSKIN